MSKPVVLSVGGALAGVIVAFALFTLFFKGSSEPVAAVATPEPTPVSVAGKLGPHVTLEDRVFNLVSPANSPIYLKLQTVIEFETTDAAWASVLHGCAKAALPSFVNGGLVSSVPGGRASSLPSAEGGAGGSACQAQYDVLLGAFVEELGTGVQLIEDAVTTIVTSHTPEEISTTAGKEALKGEIERAVNELFEGEPRVTRVLFTNFITQ